MTTQTMRRTRATGVLALVLLVARVSGLWAQTAPEAVEYYHVDALGSVRLITDATGAVVARLDYEPFGAPVTVPTPPPTTRQFTGKERDAETALHYFGARYYRADLGQFTTVDPGHVNGQLEDPDSWSAYAYSRNNPLRFIDPDGREYVVCTRAGGCAMVANGVWDPTMINAEGRGFSFVDGAIWALVEGKWTFAGTYTRLDADPPVPSFQNTFGRAGVLAAAELKYGASGMGMSAATGATAGLAAGAFGGGLTSSEVLGIGRIAAAVRPSPGQVAQMQQILAKRGRAGVEKAIRSLERRLAEHGTKIDQASRGGGYTSSMETEVRNVRQLIEAAKQVLGK